MLDQLLDPKARQSVASVVVIQTTAARHKTQRDGVPVRFSRSPSDRSSPCENPLLYHGT